jgi:hypothetical protein
MNNELSSVSSNHKIQWCAVMKEKCHNNLKMNIMQWFQLTDMK